MVDMLKAVAFDLDGTITRPFLNFARIRTEVGASFGRQSLLDQIEAMPEAERRKALAVLERHEKEASINAELNRGVKDMLDKVRELGLHNAVITRNSDESTFRVIELLGIEFERVITRDSGMPIKPDPAPLLSLLEEWKISPAEALMVGDFLYDVECGKAAGVHTCFVTNGREGVKSGGADYVVAFPDEVTAIIEKLAR